MVNQAFKVIEKVKNVATYRQILNKPINGLLSFIEFGPIYRSYLENGRRFAHIRWIPVKWVLLAGRYLSWAPQSDEGCKSHLGTKCNNSA